MPPIYGFRVSKAEGQTQTQTQGQKSRSEATASSPLESKPKYPMARGNPEPDDLLGCLFFKINWRRRQSQRHVPFPRANTDRGGEEPQPRAHLVVPATPSAGRAVPHNTSGPSDPLQEGLPGGRQDGAHHSHRPNGCCWDVLVAETGI